MNWNEDMNNVNNLEKENSQSRENGSFVQIDCL